MPLLVTHKAPDLDAIASVWLLTRFDAQHFAGSRIAFVPAGQTITDEAAARLGYLPTQVTHVDTGMGKFDHHQQARAGREYSAAKLIYDYLLEIHPDLKHDEALKLMVDHFLDVDHFGEAFWPDANHPRYQFMLHHLLTGMDSTQLDSDNNQVDLGCRLLDFVYASMKHFVTSQQKLTEGETFDLKTGGKGFALLTNNDEVIATAQKAGYQLAIVKSEKTGHIRIKARPDAPFDLKPVYDEILQKDPIGTWYYHLSGKMLLNGSKKNSQQVASPLSLAEVVAIVRKYL